MAQLQRLAIVGCCCTTESRHKGGGRVTSLGASSREFVMHRLLFPFLVCSVVACGEGVQGQVGPDGSARGRVAVGSASAAAPTAAVPSAAVGTQAGEGRDTEPCLVHCAQRGLCDRKDGQCVATTEQHCRASRACLDWGACMERAGDCVATRDEDCQAAWVCKLSGKCSARDGVCRATRDRDCKKSTACRFKRRCRVRKGRCTR
jgi:hypothetical protein